MQCFATTDKPLQRLHAAVGGFANNDPVLRQQEKLSNVSAIPGNLPIKAGTASSMGLALRLAKAKRNARKWDWIRTRSNSSELARPG